MRRDHTDAEVSKRLETIETGIQDLSQSLKQRQSMSSSSSEATKTFEQFLQAANTFKSSASTVINGDASTVKGGLETQYGGSIFGDSLSDDRYEIIQSWIPPPSPLGIRGASSADGNSKKSGLSNRSSLPELMAVLETVTQMADQYRSSEQERNSSKDEQLGSLEMENGALEQKLEKTQAQANTQLKSFAAREEHFRELVKESEVCKYREAQFQKDLKQQQDKLASLCKERDVLWQDVRQKDATLETMNDHMKIMETELKYELTVLRESLEKQKAFVRLFKEEGDTLRDTIASQAKFKEESQKSRDEANGLKDELRRLCSERDLTKCKLEKEKGRVENWMMFAEELKAGKIDSDNELTRLKTDLEKSRSDNQYLENRLRAEVEDFNRERKGLESEVYDTRNKLETVAKMLEQEKERANTCVNTIAALAKLQEQQSKLLSIYKVPAGSTQSPQSTQPAPASPKQEVAPQTTQQTNTRSQDENRKQNNTVTEVYGSQSERKPVDKGEDDSQFARERKPYKKSKSTGWVFKGRNKQNSDAVPMTKHMSAALLQQQRSHTSRDDPPAVQLRSDHTQPSLTHPQHSDAHAVQHQSSQHHVDAFLEEQDSPDGKDDEPTHPPKACYEKQIDDSETERCIVDVVVDMDPPCCCSMEEVIDTPHEYNCCTLRKVEPDHECNGGREEYGEEGLPPKMSSDSR